MLGTHERLTAEAFSFADDAEFVQDTNTTPQLVSSTLKSMEEFDGFCQDSNIPLNVSKCEVMNSTGKDLKMVYKGMKIPHKREARILGVRLNDHLKNLPQIRHLNSKLPAISILIKGFGPHMNEKFQGQVASGHIKGPFNHASAYDYAWNVNQYAYHQTRINNILQSHSSWRAIKDAKDGKIEDRRLQRKIIRMAAAADLRFRNGTGSRKIQLPIYYLLKRNNSMTIMNTQRCNWQSRFHKILITARPVVEYNDLIRYFVDPIFDQNQRIRRRNTDFPYFRLTLREDHNAQTELMEMSNPTIFIKEFRRTRATFNDFLGDKRSLKMVKEFYKSRCQHTEWTGYRCDNCDIPENSWRNDTTRTIRMELENAQATDPILELVLEDGDWVSRAISEENVTENTILVQDLDNRITASRDNSLLSNHELINLLNTYQGRLQNQQ